MIKRFIDRKPSGGGSGNPEVISSPVGLVPRNALVVTEGIAHSKPTYHYQSGLDE